MAKKQKAKPQAKEIDTVFEEEDLELLDFTISEIIDKFKITLPQEISVIQNSNNDWSNKELMSETEDFYEIENLFVSMHVAYIKEILDTLKGKSRNEAPYAFKWIDELKSSFAIHDKRVMFFLKNETQSDIDISSENLSLIKKRVEFRSTVSKNHAKYKKIIKLIPEDGATAGIPLILHASNKQIGLCVSQGVESKYPQVKSLVEKLLS